MTSRATARILGLASAFLVPALSWAAQEGSIADARMRFDELPSAFRAAEEPVEEARVASPFETPVPGIEDIEGTTGAVGILVGVLRAHRSDNASYFAGVHAQLQVAEFLALELTGWIHRAEYESQQVIARQIPVRLSASLFPFPSWEIRPYLTGGVGLYYTELEYRGVFENVFKDESKTAFGTHAGLGFALKHHHASVTLEGGYDRVNLDVTALDSNEFNFWRVTFSLNIWF